MTDVLLPATSSLLRVALPLFDPGPEELTVYWPIVVQSARFLIGFLAVVLLGRIFLQPLLARVVRRRNRNNPTLQTTVVLYFRLVVILVATFVGIAVAGYGGILSDSALIISAVALAVGLAAREVMGSLVSGMALVLDPEFSVGDYIQWQGGEGTVKSVALRITRVETVDGELVTIPNTILTTREVIRPYGRGNRRVVQELGIAYDDDISEVLSLLEEAAAETDTILPMPAPEAYVDELGDDEVTIRVYYWIDDPNRREFSAVRSAYVRSVKDRLEAEGVTINPPPERDIQGRLTIDEST